MVAILWGISAAAATWPLRPVSVHSDCQAALTVADGTGVKFFADGLQAVLRTLAMIPPGVTFGYHYVPGHAQQPWNELADSVA
eukprot:2024956-Prorocentrum_lima.AAC.1